MQSQFSRVWWGLTVTCVGRAPHWPYTATHASSWNVTGARAPA